MSNRENSIVLTKAFDFADKIVRLNSQLTAEEQFIFSGQLLRRGTSIGASVNESLAA
ncbi:MAG: four helix bundle protein [Bacteroidetes bacterium]|nr:four helix bundle protein [Bacteroidota bacterium]